MNRIVNPLLTLVAALFVTTLTFSEAGTMPLRAAAAQPARLTA